MAPMKAAHPLPLPMRPAGFLLPTLAALALASCAAPPPPPPPTASVPPPAPTEQSPPPAAPAQAQAPFITPEQMALSPSPSPPPPPATPAAQSQAPFVTPGEMALSPSRSAQKAWEAAAEARISEYSQQQNLGGSSSCYTGPRGGTYTLTRSGKKNYGGC